MKQEIRKFTTESGHIYIQKKRFNEKGELESETWIKKGKSSFLINDAAFVSAKTYCRLQGIYSNYTEKEKSNDSKLMNLINIGKIENYRGKEGKIIYLILKEEEKGKKGIWQSGPVIKIEPPFE